MSFLFNRQAHVETDRILFFCFRKTEEKREWRPAEAVPEGESPLPGAPVVSLREVAGVSSAGESRGRRRLAHRQPSAQVMKRWRSRRFLGAVLLLVCASALGHVPLMPGTAGGLGGVLLALAVAVAVGRLRRRARLLVAAGLVVLAIAVCEYGPTAYAGKDDPHIVADELLAFPLATAASPVRGHPLLLAGLFFSSCILDVFKPPPARAVESLPGGIGIVLDDVVANLWTVLFGLIGWRWHRKRRAKGR